MSTTNISVTAATKGSLLSITKNKGLAASGQLVADIKRGVDTFKIDADNVWIEEGFNVRDIDQEHVDRLCQALLNDASFPPIEVRLVDVTNSENGESEQRVKVIDGHHRTLAARKAKELGWEGKLIAMNFQGSQLDELVRMVTSTMNRKLTDIELAGAMMRMKKMGMNNADIAKSLGENPMKVGALLKIAEAPIELQEMIKNKEIPVTTVSELIRKENNFTQVIASAKQIATEKQAWKEEKAQAKVQGRAPVKANVQTLKKIDFNSRERLACKDLIQVLGTAIPEKLPEGDKKVNIALTREEIRQLQELSARINEIERYNNDIDMKKLKAVNAKKEA